MQSLLYVGVWYRNLHFFEFAFLISRPGDSETGFTANLVLILFRPGTAFYGKGCQTLKMGACLGLPSSFQLRS